MITISYLDPNDDHLQVTYISPDLLADIIVALVKAGCKISEIHT